MSVRRWKESPRAFSVRSFVAQHPPGGRLLFTDGPTVLSTVLTQCSGSGEVLPTGKSGISVY